MRLYMLKKFKGRRRTLTSFAIGNEGRTSVVKFSGIKAENRINLGCKREPLL